jgi:hypothetical protein
MASKLGESGFVTHCIDIGNIRFSAASGRFHAHLGPIALLRLSSSVLASLSQ